MSHDGAKAMYEMGQRAADAAHELMLAMIDASSLSEQRKIGVAAAAVTLLYRSFVDAVNDNPNEGLDNLMLGMFNGQISPRIMTMAKRAKKREEKK